MSTFPARRWLLYAPNGFGLGHVVRTLALARNLRRLSPESKFLFLTDCEAPHLLWDEGFPVVKLISFQAVHKGMIGERRALAVNRAVCRGVFDSFKPDVFIADSFPDGRLGELRDSVPDTVRRVLLCREKTPKDREAAKFQAALARYELVLLSHRPGEVTFPVPAGVALHECGYFLVRDGTEILSRADARKRLGLPQDAFVVLLAFGAGGDKKFPMFLDRVLQVADAQPDWTFAAVAGPYLRDRPSDAGGRLRFFSHFPLIEVCRAFDAAISALGDLTMGELLHHGIPTLFAPRLGMEDDQRERARRLVAAKAASASLELEPDLVRRWFAVIADPAARKRIGAAARRFVPRNGAADGAGFLLEWLGRAGVAGTGDRT